jgi:hypothetical protein
MIGIFVSTIWGPKFLLLLSSLRWGQWGLEMVRLDFSCPWFSLRKFGALFGEEYKSETEKLYGDLRKLIHGEDTV